MGRDWAVTAPPHWPHHAGGRAVARAEVSPGKAAGCPVRPLLCAWETRVQISLRVQSEQAVNLSVFPGGVPTAPGSSEAEPVCPLTRREDGGT